MPKNKIIGIVIISTILACITIPLAVFAMYSFFEAEDINLMNRILDFGVILYLASASTSLIFNSKLYACANKSVFDNLVIVSAALLVLITLFVYMPNIIQQYLA